jgi:hypothetical protein
VKSPALLVQNTQDIEYRIMCAYAGIEKLLYDWQTLIAGFMALAAGVGAVWITRIPARQQVAAANRQTEAVRQQNAELRRSEERELARETLVAARLFGGIIANLMESTKGAHPITVILPDVPVYEVIDHLGKLNRESIDKYFMLANKVHSFKHRGSPTVNKVTGDLDQITAIAASLADEISQESIRCIGVLLRTQDT